jgi:hypothetical protein
MKQFLRTMSLQRVADILKLKLDGVLFKTQSNLNIQSGRNITFSQTDTKDLSTVTVTAGKNGVLGYWGNFFDTTTQTVTSTTEAYVINLNSADPQNDGVVVTNGNKIVPTTPGVYNISFSAQVSNTDSQLHDASFWYRKNGVDVPYSASILSIPNKHGGINGRIIFYVDIVLKLQPTDYIQLAWSATNTALSLETIPAGTIAPSPVSPSVICSVVQI